MSAPSRPSEAHVSRPKTDALGTVNAAGVRVLGAREVDAMLFQTIRLNNAIARRRAKSFSRVLPFGEARRSRAGSKISAATQLARWDRTTPA